MVAKKTSKVKQISFLVSSKVNLGVLESQVFKLASYLADQDAYQVKVLICDNPIEIDKRKYSKDLEFTYVDKNFDFSQVKKSNVYIRSIDVFFKYYLKLKRNKNRIIYDFRALLCVESFDRNKNYLRYLVIFFMEMTAYLLANRVSTVSHNLKRKLADFFVIRRKVSVFPCLVVGAERTQRERNYDPKQPLEFVYMGSINSWQKFNSTIDLYKNFIENNISSKLTVITKDKEKAIQILSDKKVTAVVKSLTNSEVLEDLKKYDFGFLLRDNTLLNNISSPIKFQEYLISGVIPIMSEGIGDYSKEVQDYDLAVLIKESETVSIDELVRLLKDKTLEGRVEAYMLNYDFEEKVKEHPILF